MHSPETEYLPQELNLELVAAELGFSDRSKRSQLEVILYHQRKGKLLLKSLVAKNVNVQETRHGLETIFDTLGNATSLSVGNNFWIDTCGDPIILGPAYLVCESRLVVNSFIFQGNEYYPLEESGMHPEPIHFGIHEVYVDRDDLNSFLQKGVTEMPAYADPGGEYFAPELELAVRLHKALRIEGRYNPHWNMEDRINLWLQKNTGGAKSENQLKRLSAIIGSGKK